MLQQSELDIAAGQAALRMGDIDTARTEFQRVLETEPKEPEALVGMAETYFHALNNEKGSEVLEHALSQNPNHARVLYAMGSYHENLDNYDQALQFYEQAQAQDRNSQEIAAAVERIKYYQSGEAVTLADNTYIGDHSGIKSRLLSFAPFAGTSGLVKTMTHFYKHIGKPFESNIWHKLVFIRPSIGIVIALFGLLFLMMGQKSDQYAVAILVLVSGGGLAYVGFKAKASLNVFLDDVRQHFIDDTGSQVADPDRGSDELCKIVKKSNMGLMFLVYLTTRWMYASREEYYEVFERLDLPKFAWWEFKKKSRFAKAKNMRKLVDEALNRHWLFHLRNPRSQPSWQAGLWSDDNSYARHLLQGEDADGFDFKPPRPGFMGKVLRLFWLPLGLAAAGVVGMVGIFMVITIVMAEQGQRLLEEYVPAVLFLRKPQRSRGILSVPIKNGLVVRSDIVSPML